MSDGSTHRTAPRVLLSIQYLRAVAALMVVLFHARSPREFLYNPISWHQGLASGVDIFFVISGFIMLTAAAGETPCDFYRRRIIRVMPLYWLMTLLFIAVQSQKYPIPLSDIVQSLLLIPHYSTQFPGKIWPLLIPGWTLSYEMVFYALFGIGLAFGKVVRITTLAIGGMILAGWLWQPGGAILKSFTDMRMAEFLAGLYVAIAFQRYRFDHLKWLLPVGFALILGSDFIGAGVRGFAIGAAAVMVVVGALAHEGKAGVAMRPIPKLLGDASYSIYLTHTIFGIGIANRVIPLLPLHGPMQLVLYLLVSLFVSIIAGILLHRYCEKPLTRWLTRITQPERRLPVASAATP